MMTGQMVINGSPDRHTRITFNLSDNGTLLYNDQRRFGQLRVVERLDQVKHLNILGPEPFDEEFSLPYIQEALQRTDRPIKNILLDHTFVAGIGNIYACEILYRCQINPRRPGRKISFKEIQTLQEAIIEVLNEAIDHRGSSMRNYRDASGQKGRFNEMLSVYAREGLTCPRCRHKILRITQSGRSTFYCGHCQK